MSEALRRLANRRILFGHQSVGANVVRGLRRLADDQPEEGPRVTSIDQPLNGPAIVDVLIGSNGSPASKIAHFDRLMEGAPGDWAEVAFFKLCYADVDAQTDVRELFESYRLAHEARVRRRPHTIFVHVTTPLTAEPSGPKAWVRRIAGSRPSPNASRHGYNDLLRRRFAGKEPVFDLAQAEAPGGDGLARGYTDDGAHLNAHGQLAVAAELVALLATL